MNREIDVTRGQIKKMIAAGKSDEIAALAVRICDGMRLVEMSTVGSEVYAGGGDEYFYTKDNHQINLSWDDDASSPFYGWVLDRKFDW